MPWYSIQYFPILQCFSDTFASANNLIRQKNTVWKADEIVIESNIVSNDVAYNTGRKTWQTDRPREIYQSWDTPGDTKRPDRSAWQKVSLKKLGNKCKKNNDRESNTKM